MKKLVFMFVAMAAISFASCGGNNANGAANDSDSVKGDSAIENAVEENADSANLVQQDSANVDSAANA